MSASPQPTQSAKRPLEESSSPSRNDQPEAKRLALDKVVKDAQEEVETPALEDSHNADETAGSATPTPAPESNGTNAKGDKPEAQDAQGDTVVPDAPESKTTKEHGPRSRAQPPVSAQPHDETAWIHVRSVISSPEAATIIGKGGENVSKIREMSNAKCTVSDYQKGAVERILTVSGVVDAVAKAFGLIIRTLNNEPLAEPSNTHSKTYPLRLLIPHVLIGSIIGKGGARIKEIQEASGARLNASDSCLPLSTERSLVVMGVADAVHIATYYVGSTLLEQLNERFGGPAASAYAHPLLAAALATAITTSATAAPTPGPSTACRPASTLRPMVHLIRPSPTLPSPMHYGGHAAAGYGAAAPHVAPHVGHAGPGPHPAGPHGAPVAGAALTQQIYIPNDMVGAIIGKGGQKINEIRQISGSVIKINEPQDNSNERLVTITGTEECNRMALYLLYQRLGELQNNARDSQQPKH
ncbi:unnamed protein product [Sordaria macrospora k-hell]|uniref:WGS project CABT00000000 data, contig 2.1 n=1 Tax=Sordaria macrospora (strain ATCC MYA-333 / DSM 997 / K(L3346) / K-hell) TaxID=771870 RepID=F7VLW4_SORMK|nr:uncharacterized protein SMAC_04885 [Sordaria macrospora k-hell]CCC06492.1 unnamed protein product [Sordaria macrospora k-hell]